MAKRKLEMDIINPNAAGIDIGSRSHFVAINQEHSDVREFGVYAQRNSKFKNTVSVYIVVV